MNDKIWNLEWIMVVTIRGMATKAENHFVDWLV